jgi:hypothetical protein
MWFIVRVAFCVGLVFSMTPGAEVIDDAGKAPAALAATAALGMRDLVDGALQTCSNDAKPCIEATRLLARSGTGGGALTPRGGAPRHVRLVADTLTVGDRAAPWRGAVKEPRGSTREGTASRPAI